MRDPVSPLHRQSSFQHTVTTIIIITTGYLAMSATRQDSSEEINRSSPHNVYVVGFVESDTSRFVLAGAQISRVSYRIASGSYCGWKPVVHGTGATTADASTRSLVHLDALRLRTQVHVLV